jgi:autotransporter-associated beta strand protein
MRLPRVALAAAVLSAPALPSFSAIPAFPGAEGYGAYATGGRGGDVYHVTNLNASGAGSFADAIATVPSAGRTIVFDVSGYIRLPSGSSGTRMTASKVTIAGQTAPGDGIGFYNNFFRISGDDIVVRHLRFRLGYYSSGGDCVDLDSGCNNAVLDHVSMEFSTDENMSSFGSPPENLTLQYSLNAWGLETHSCGGLWDQNHATSHHNLWAYNHTRNPKSRPGGLLEWINNVTYDWDIGFIMGDTETATNYASNVINNYFLSPAGNTQSKAMVKGTIASNGKPNFTIFLSGNLMDNDGDGLLNGIDKGYAIVEGTGYAPGTSGLTTGDKGYYQATGAISGSTAGVATDSPLLAYKKIVSNAGALRLDASYTGGLRDEVDTILFNRLVTQTHTEYNGETGIHKESDTGASNGGFGTLASTTAPTDTDQDGMPDAWENALGFNAASDDHNTVFPSSGGVITGTTFFPANTPAGYTYLEEYLHFLAIPHTWVPKNTASVPSSVDIDLRKFTSGFSNTPVFTVANVVGGTATQSGTGGYLVHFVPTVNAAGRAKFDFMVTDADGTTWTQQFGLLVTTAALPRDLTWKGDGTTNAWNSTANDWLVGGAATGFSTGDYATFDDTGSNSPSVALTESVTPSAITVNGTKDYTFSGSGSITSSGGLVKRGTGTLTIANGGTNAISGNLLLQEGTLALGSGGLGTAKVSMLGGTLTSNYGSTTLLTLGGGVSVSSGVNATINMSARMAIAGGSGAGTLNLNVPGTVFIYDALNGSWSNFTGTLNVTGTVANAELTAQFNGGGFDGALGGAAVNLDNVKIIGRHNSGGNTLTIGALSGTSTAQIVGSGYAGAMTLSTGALNRSTTFAGAITDGGVATVVTKTGSGTLTLSGTNTYTGATTLSGGGLLVSGSLGATAVSVASGTTLSGAGTIGGAVTVASGGTLSPGNTTGAAANLNLGAVSLTTATLPFDLSSNPAGTNDHIQIATGGALGVTGTQTFQFNLVNGTLGAGTYKLIETTGTLTASGASLVSNLPTGSRQTFSLQRNSSGSAPGYIQLVVSGTAASLVWTGAGGNIWDTNTTAGWSNGGSADTFYNFDAVTFDDTASSGSVVIGTAVQPRSIVVNNTTRDYILSGGGITGTGSLTKNGTGKLTLSPTATTLSSTTTASSTSVTLASTAGLSAGMAVSGTGIAAGTTIASITNGTTLVLSQAATASGTANLSYVASNSFSGGLTLNAGTIALATDNANSSGLGSGPVTMNGGVITMYDNASSYNSFYANLVVPTGATADLYADSRVDMYGTLTGGGTLNFHIPWVRTTLFTDWSGFTGTLNVSGGDLRMGTSYAFPGFPNAIVNLGAGCVTYYTGTLSAGAGTTVSFGQLSGTATSVLQGGATGGRALTYRIGGRNTDATFAGTIGEQGGIGGGNITSYVKTGTGTWTLSGTCAYNGGTTVEQGTLRILGSLTSNGGQLAVAAAATLKLEGGTITVDATDIAANAQLIGNGTITGDLNNNGSVSSSTGGTLTIGGSVVNNGSIVISNSSKLQIDGDMVNNGTLYLTSNGQLAGSGSVENDGIIDMMTGLQSLPVGFVNNGIVLDSSKVAATTCGLSGVVFTVSVKGYTGHYYQLQKTSTLTTNSWQDVGAAEEGTGVLNGDGVTLDLKDYSATGSKNFYRVVVTP